MSSQPYGGTGTEPGLLRSLTNLSFDSFITSRLVRWVYTLGVIGGGIGAAILLLFWLLGGGTRALIGLVVIPLGYLLLVIALRVWLELVIVVFRIADFTRDTARNVQRLAAEPAVMPRQSVSSSPKVLEPEEIPLQVPARAPSHEAVAAPPPQTKQLPDTNQGMEEDRATPNEVAVSDRRCPNCNTRNPLSYQFCSRCGRPLAVP